MFISFVLALNAPAIHLPFALIKWHPAIKETLNAEKRDKISYHCPPNASIVVARSHSTTAWHCRFMLWQRQRLWWFAHLYSICFNWIIRCICTTRHIQITACFVSNARFTMTDRERASERERAREKESNQNRDRDQSTAWIWLNAHGLRHANWFIKCVKWRLVYKNNGSIALFAVNVAAAVFFCAHAAA